MEWGGRAGLCVCVCVLCLWREAKGVWVGWEGWRALETSALDPVARRRVSLFTVQKGDHTNPDNYKGISLLSMVRKGCLQFFSRFE